MQPTEFDRLLQSLRNPEIYPHPVSGIRVIETHISAVLLTGDFAYKIKKPLNMGFLDFSTLARRKHFCEEEIRLNRRLAPDLYLETVVITGSPEAPVIGGPGEPVEYMVRMRQFDPDQQLDQLLQRGELLAHHVDDLITRIADFHTGATPAGSSSPFGTPNAVFDPMQQNFDQLSPVIKDPEQRKQLERLEHWTKQQFEKLSPLLEKRRASGYIRECHGDMHLGNMALVDQRLAIFDGIEFNDAFRWIDVANEIAFFIMDLERRGAISLANRALNTWLEITGDREALQLMRFYQTYRAMVRAKVASIRLGQAGLTETERTEVLDAYQRYADLAEHYTQPEQTALIITHGFSGAGKTTISSRLVEDMGMIRLRSDIERKRLHGLSSDISSQSGISTGIYTEDATTQTYTRLLEEAQRAIECGFSVIVDASFLSRKQREQFSVLADTLQIPFLILDVQATENTLKSRISQREHDASEATTEVLEWQLEHADALEEEENRLVVSSQQPLSLDTLREQLRL